MRNEILSIGDVNASYLIIRIVSESYTLPEEGVCASQLLTKYGFVGTLYAVIVTHITYYYK